MCLNCRMLRVLWGDATCCLYNITMEIENANIQKTSGGWGIRLSCLFAFCTIRNPRPLTNSCGVVHTSSARNHDDCIQNLLLRHILLRCHVFGCGWCCLRRRRCQKSANTQVNLADIQSKVKQENQFDLWVLSVAKGGVPRRRRR